MVLTKDELLDLLATGCENTFVAHMALFSRFVHVLDWSDDEPRDIRDYDVYELEKVVAEDLDRVLSHLESAVKTRYKE